MATALDIPEAELTRLETGASRASAAQLFGLAYLFGVPVGHFFRDAPVDERPPEGSKVELGLLKAASELDDGGRRFLLAIAKLIQYSEPRRATR